MQAWLSRVLQSGPRLVSLLLAALIVGECLRVVLMLLSGRPAAALPPISKKLTSQPHRASRLDIQSILTAHLFGVTDDDVTHQSEQAFTVDTNLLLLGTVATENPIHGVAIISADGAAKVFNVGEEVNGATLQSVYLDRVILNRSGKFVTLALPLRLSVSGDSAKRPLLKSVDDAAQPVGPLDLRDLGEAISAKASIDEESQQLRGFMIQPNKVRRAFYDFGLRPRDLVIAVNGTTVVNQDRAHSQKIVDTTLGSGQAIFTIVRFNGEPQDISLDIAQFRMTPIAAREILKY